MSVHSLTQSASLATSFILALGGSITLVQMEKFNQTAGDGFRNAVHSAQAYIKEQGGTETDLTNLAARARTGNDLIIKLPSLIASFAHDPHNCIAEAQITSAMALIWAETQRLEMLCGLLSAE